MGFSTEKIARCRAILERDRRERFGLAVRKPSIDDCYCDPKTNASEIAKSTAYMHFEDALDEIEQYRRRIGNMEKAINEMGRREFAFLREGKNCYAVVSPDGFVCGRGPTPVDALIGATWKIAMAPIKRATSKKVGPPPEIGGDNG